MRNSIHNFQVLPLNGEDKNVTNVVLLPNKTRS